MGMLLTVLVRFTGTVMMTLASLFELRLQYGAGHSRRMLEDQFASVDGGGEHHP
jgi:hypothetical protein